MTPRSSRPLAVVAVVAVVTLGAFGLAGTAVATAPADEQQAVDAAVAAFDEFAVAHGIVRDTDSDPEDAFLLIDPTEAAADAEDDEADDLFLECFDDVLANLDAAGNLVGTTARRDSDSWELTDIAAYDPAGTTPPDNTPASTFPPIESDDDDWGSSDFFALLDVEARAAFVDEGSLTQLDAVIAALGSESLAECTGRLSDLAGEDGDISIEVTTRDDLAVGDASGQFEMIVSQQGFSYQVALTIARAGNGVGFVFSSWSGETPVEFDSVGAVTAMVDALSA